MKNFDKKFGILHFIGIGGIGMSGIAEVLFNLGYKVTGSDLVENQKFDDMYTYGTGIFLVSSKVAICFTKRAFTLSYPTVDPEPYPESRRKKRWFMKPLAESNELTVIIPISVTIYKPRVITILKIWNRKLIFLVF